MNATLSPHQPSNSITTNKDLPAPVTVSYGDGIGPEIMEAVLRILEAAGARLRLETIEVGEKVYRSGNTSGIAPEAWDSLARTKVLLKAPITTPQGSGYKSLNVTMRKVLGLYANVRPNITYAPYIPTEHPRMNMVIIRENEEDLYAGIEHQQTDEVIQCLKLVSKPGTEKIIRYAFEYARRYGRKKVTCMTKDNIMKQTDGMFHRMFKEIGAEYPEIEQEHFIIDIGAARIARTPERFDVVVTLNLYGDIISDIAAEVGGSVGLAGSANIGEAGALFEAIHGSAPDIAGKNIANPSGLLQAAIQMLLHIGQAEVATKVQNAWLRTIEDGIHTADIYNSATSTQKAGTREFADALIARLGQVPAILKPVNYNNDAGNVISVQLKPRPVAQKTLVGIDVFLHWNERRPETLASRLQPLSSQALALTMITNRGVKVWPEGNPATFCTDHWRCRFKCEDFDRGISYEAVLQLLKGLHQAGMEVIKTENLYTFDGQPGFTLGQGQ